MKFFQRRKMSTPLLIAAACAIPVVAYAATAVRVTVNGQPTFYRAIIVNGTTYVALRDVATLTGRSVSYNGRARIVDISGGNSSSNGNGGNMGGTTQRTGNEGAIGQMLTVPHGSLRVTKSEIVDEYDAKWTRIHGIIRNTSKTEVSYGLKSARLALKDGRQIDMTLGANEVGGGSYAGLQRGEETALNIAFKGEFSPAEIDRVVKIGRAHV